MSLTLTPPKKSHVHKNSNQSTAVKSANISPEKSNKFTSAVKEIPLDPQSRYSISYVPGMVEHEYVFPFIYSPKPPIELTLARPMKMPR